MKLNPLLQLRLQQYLSTPSVLGINIDLSNMLQTMKDCVIDSQKYTQENLLAQGEPALLAKIDISNKHQLLSRPCVLSLDQRALSVSIGAIPSDYQEGRGHED
jgi:hypothetical protein